MTESELCAGFITVATRDGKWRAYPETAGFDVLMVRECGLQIGIEAKLALNVKVVQQALPSLGTWAAGLPGPHYRAVLVPQGRETAGLSEICAWLGVTVIRFAGVPEGMDGYVPSGKGYSITAINPALPGGHHSGDECWHEWLPARPCDLPDYIPDVRAGCPAPVALTPWKIKAIKLAVILEERPVSRADFKALGLDPSRWTQRPFGWLTPTPAGYVPGPNMPDFRRQHPVNYEQIKAEKAQWMHARPAVHLALDLKGAG
jgi:hypothetical protein